ncbi:FecR domain-containing protein [Agriterribacter sp.]|uniref:FecR family protein n=1 Tax=Agriterribacter sp. TaxID=2821509 RepID=UPI002C3E5645|nr:FecR domain-containing protein [Agriterribacter sp.]HRP55477.1 FecR domain-containing protein [Agriterribacter sp.]
MEERIRYLLRQYENNRCSQEELEELFYYIRNTRSSEASLKRMVRKIYDDIRKNHPSFTYVDENGRLVLTEPDQVNVATGKQIRKKKIKTPVLIVLVAAILMVSAAVWLLRRDMDGHTKAHRNTAIVLTKKFSERSEQKYLLLPDSTEVWMNAASSLEFPDEFNNNKREVLLNGEAFFKVKHVPDKPFIIHTGKVSAIVSGTSFNIKAYPGQKELIISVSRGRVNVEQNQNIVATLTKGQQVKIDNAEEKITEKNIAVSKIAAWRQGDMIYDDEVFTDIVADLERIYNVNIDIVSKDVPQLRISASFRKDIGISQALLIFCKLSDTKLHNEGRKFVIR